MTRVIRRYLPDGSTRSLWDDSRAERDRAHGLVPHRASRIEAIEDGPRAGLFSVDFTPLGEATGDDRYRCCLREAFSLHGAALAREVEWLEAHYIKGES